jgi:hypothetical protein
MPAEPHSSPSEVVGPVEPDGRKESGRAIWLGAAVVVLACGLLNEARLWRPETTFTIKHNVQIAEADAWWHGRLDLAERRWDTALKDGRAYSCYPPLFTFLAAALWPVFHGVPHWAVVLLVLPIPLLAYVLFRRRTGSAGWGALLAIGLVCGTSLLPVLDKTLRGASHYYINHALATIGLLILLIESFGRRRVWVCGFGLAVSALSRQLTLAYLLPVAWLAVCGVSGPRGAEASTRHVRTSRVAQAAIAGLFVVAVLMTMNTLKFGRPWDSGYAHIFNERSGDRFADDVAAHGLFSVHYVPRNLYYMNFGFPEVHRIEMAGESQVHLRPNTMGTGIWWTTPLLLWLFVGLRRLAADPLSRWYLVGAVLVVAVLLFYHNTGAQQRGFNRFSLDYIPVLLALVAPWCVAGRRRWITVAMVAFGVWYFRFWLAWPHVRIW